MGVVVPVTTTPHMALGRASMAEKSPGSTAAGYAAHVVAPFAPLWRVNLPAGHALHVFSAPRAGRFRYTTSSPPHEAPAAPTPIFLFSNSSPRASPCTTSSSTRLASALHARTLACARLCPS